MCHSDFTAKYIPSADVRNAVLESGYRFSDWDRAALIWNSDFPLDEKCRDILKIAEESFDEELKKQIGERLSYEEDIFKAFSENTGGFIFAVNCRRYGPEDNIAGYFAGYELAYKHGCRLGDAFSIEKHQVVDEYTEIIGQREINGPMLQPDKEKQIVEVEYYGPVSRVEYDREGRSTGMYSVELPKERQLVVETLDSRRFENRYVVFPKIFGEGEEVRLIKKKPEDKDITGFISYGGWNYEERIKRATAKDSVFDYSDTFEMVRYFDEETGEWEHVHISPIYLEKAGL